MLLLSMIADSEGAWESFITINVEAAFTCVLVLAGTGLIFLTAACMVTCFGFLIKQCWSHTNLLDTVFTSVKAFVISLYSSVNGLGMSKRSVGDTTGQMIQTTKEIICTIGCHTQQQKGREWRLRYVSHCLLGNWLGIHLLLWKWWASDCLCITCFVFVFLFLFPILLHLLNYFLSWFMIPFCSLGGRGWEKLSEQMCGAWMPTSVNPQCCGITQRITLVSNLLPGCKRFRVRIPHV